MLAAVAVGLYVAQFVTIIVAAVLAFRRSKENARTLARIESRCTVTDQRIGLWMKHATTLPAQPAVRIDPRREPDDV